MDWALGECPGCEWISRRGGPGADDVGEFGMTFQEGGDVGALGDDLPAAAAGFFQTGANEGGGDAATACGFRHEGVVEGRQAAGEPVGQDGGRFIAETAFEAAA